MRVIAGSLRGRRLTAPRGEATRPTSDRLREALFGVLGDVHDLDVLDLYAGTGSLGIEALSRGAASALFVERARPAIGALRQNLRTLGLGERSAVLPTAVNRASATLADRGPFHLVLADPPYALVESERLAAELKAATKAGAWWRSEALLVLEHRSKDAPPGLLEALGVELEQTRRYGGSSITFYRWPTQDPCA
jgi:16S rRNA (guanine966-N2)-methyltransferase